MDTNLKIYVDMKKALLLSFIALLSVCTGLAQRKKLEALQLEKDMVQKALDSVQASLILCKRNEKTNEIRLEALKNQVEDLKGSNATLLSNVESFAKISNQKESNLEMSLQNSQLKDNQINAINDAIKSNDSLVLALVTSLNGSLQNVQANKIAASPEDGAVFIAFSNDFLFTEDGKNISEEAKSQIEQLTATLKHIEIADFTVDSFEEKTADTLVDSWGLSLKKATMLTAFLRKNHGMKIGNISSYYKEDPSGGIPNAVTRLVITPKFDDFYDKIKKILKEG